MIEKTRHHVHPKARVKTRQRRRDLYYFLLQVVVRVRRTHVCFVSGLVSLADFLAYTQYSTQNQLSTMREISFERIYLRTMCAVDSRRLSGRSRCAHVRHWLLRIPVKRHHRSYLVVNNTSIFC